MKKSNRPLERFTARDVASLTALLEQLKEARSARRAAARLVKARPDLEFDSPDALRSWFENFTDAASGSYDKRRALAFVFMRYGA